MARTLYQWKALTQCQLYEAGISEDKVKNVRVLDLIVPTFMKFLQPKIEKKPGQKSPASNLKIKEKKNIRQENQLPSPDVNQKVI